MKKIVNIPENTDLNEFIDKINSRDQAVNFDEETLQFDPSIYPLLPYPLNLLATSIDSSRKRDTALISLLTVQSGIYRNYKVFYDCKYEGCQLFSYILGNPAQGKGFASVFRETGMKIHKHYSQEYKTAKEEYDPKLAVWENGDKEEEEPEKPKQKKLFVSADNTKAALSKELYENDGFGLIFETEADTLINANKSDFGGFSDILRRGFHGEPYSVNRMYLKNESIEIDALNVSILITSTLSQCIQMIPDYENGLFSRFIFYFQPTDSKHISPFDDGKSEKLSALVTTITEHYFEIAQLESTLEKQTIFSFTKEQQEEFNQIFASLDHQFNNKGYNHLQGSLKRMGLIFTRICMLLSYLRSGEKSIAQGSITCEDVDFSIGSTIMHKLIQHLQIIDHLYKRRNRKQNEMVMIPYSTADKTKSNNINNRLRFHDLIKSGNYSDRQISKLIWGDESHSGTANKWKWKYKEGKLLPFPEAEATWLNRINVLDVLNNTDVSLFADVYSSEVLGDTLPLYDLLTATSFKEEILQLRTEKDVERKKKRKLDLLAFTPSGLFSDKRSIYNLRKHSLFICIDIDKNGNEQIINFSEMKNELSKIVNVAFCAHSVSGIGFYLLIPITIDTNHELYFDALYQSFKELGIEIDKSCRDVSRLRIISYDEAYYMAESAVPICRTLNSGKENINFIRTNKSDKKFDFFSLLKLVKESGVDITDNRKYVDWLNIAYAIANTFGEQGREDFHTISENYKNYNKKEADYQFTACLKDTKNEKSIGLKRLFEIAKENGVDLKSEG